jgi:hypothetical protein
MIKRLWASLFVPKGLYCYDKLEHKLCRYWKSNRCKLIEFNLWDTIKVCGINEKIDKKDFEKERM